MNSSDYQPAPHVLDHLKQVRFVAVIGPTAAGKNTVIAAAQVREPQIHLVLNNTSRASRPGEQEGRDYRFLTRAAMEARIAKGEYAQVAPSLFGDYYATAPEDYRASGTMAMPVLAAAVPVFRALPFKEFRTIFILPPDYETWQVRIAVHGFEPEALHKRLVEAESSLVFALEDEQTHLVINQDIKTAAANFVTLALGKPMDSRLQADQSRAREIAGELLSRLRAAL